MNIIFAGTPQFAIPCLEALAQSHHQLLAIYTQPDRPAGRGHKLQASPVKVWGENHNIPVYQPINFKHQTSIDEFKALAPDIMIVIAYGLILPQSILSIPKYGCVNVHASLLPRWRGASPIQQSILHGDAESGVTIMQLDAGMDTGAMLATISCPIEPDDTSGRLHDKLSLLACNPLLEVLNALIANQCTPKPQDSHYVTYAPKINKEDAAINWQLPAKIICQQIRAYNPWPIAYTHMNEKTIRIHQARVIEQTNSATPGTILAASKEGLRVATKENVLLIERLQFPGGKAISIMDLLNSNQDLFITGQVFQ